MSISSMDKEKFNILPYDFVKENQIIVSKNVEGLTAISPNKIAPSLYHELYKFLKKDFVFNQCSADQFNEILTNTFSIDNTSNDIYEELSDEFDLQSFAGSISATEDLLSGGDDTPIIKLINGVISQAIKNRALFFMA